MGRVAAMAVAGKTAFPALAAAAGVLSAECSIHSLGPRREDLRQVRSQVIPQNVLQRQQPHLQQHRPKDPAVSVLFLRGWVPLFRGGWS